MNRTNKRSEEWIEKNFKILFILILILQILVFFYVVKNNLNSWDKTIWFNAIKNMAETNQYPFINTDKFVLGVTEYPIAFTYFLLLFLPFINSIGYMGFISVFGIIQIICFIGISILLLKLIRDKKRILLGFLIAPNTFILATSRFDLMPAFFTLLAIYFLIKNKNKLSSTAIAIGTFLKIYTIMLLPAIFMKNRKKFLKVLVVFIILALILNLPILLSPEKILFPIQNEQRSDYRPETYVSLLNLNGINLKYADTLNQVLLLGLLALAFFKSKTFLGRFIALVIPLLITNKIFSPQWNLWFLSLLVLTNIRIFWILLFDLITVIEFPLIWNKVNGITGFNSSLFSLNNPYCLAFIILNLARYSFYIYFYIKCINDKNLVNEKVVEREELS